MRFTLRYSGEALKSSGNSQSRTYEKHVLREHFHGQLERLWETNNALREIDRTQLSEPVQHGPVWDVGDETIALRAMPLAGFMYRRKIHTSYYVPLVTPRMEASCHLALRFGRPFKPGNIIFQGGDLDGRIKTLFDALAVPKDDRQVTQEDCKLPEYLCLLGEDSLITGLSVESYQLLEHRSPRITARSIWR